jgi:hypothetical protein
VPANNWFNVDRDKAPRFNVQALNPAPAAQAFSIHRARTSATTRRDQIMRALIAAARWGLGGSLVD